MLVKPLASCVAHLMKGINMDKLAKRKLPVIPFRVFGFSFLLAWFWIMLLFDPAHLLSWSDGVAYLAGVVATCVFVASLPLRRTHLLSKSLAFSYASLLSVLTFIMMSLSENAEVVFAPVAKLALWAVLGMATVGPILFWIKFYSKWDTDNASFYILLSFFLSSVEYLLVIAMNPTALVVITSLLPLCSFVLYSLCNTASSGW